MSAVVVAAGAQKRFPAFFTQATIRVEGQELRLRQEYFFASASLQDILRRQFRVHGDLLSLPQRTAIQLNDTHPAIGIPELMQLLVDVHGFSWDEAWEISRSTFSYTNHTLLSEALERWPVELMERVLPRHMQIIYEINARHMELVREQDEINPRSSYLLFHSLKKQVVDEYEWDIWRSLLAQD